MNRTLPSRTINSRILLCSALSLLIIAVLGACAARTTLRTIAADGITHLSPRLTTTVYSVSDENTLDIFLSDIPPSQLTRELASSARGGHAAPGVLIQLHVFLMPRAGRTPIEFTASNTTITQIITTGSSMGIYAGGGFLLPTHSFDNTIFAGSLQGASLRLVYSQPGFVDRLGSSQMDGAIRAHRDEALATQLADLVLLLLAQRESS